MRNTTKIDLEDIRLQTRRGRRSLMLALLFLLPAAFLFFHSRRLYFSFVCTSGKIVELKRQQFQKEITYYPVFSFVDQAGTIHTVHSRFGYASGGFALSHQYNVGDTVEVIYPNDNPEAARLKDFWSMWAWPIAFGSVGMFLALFGIISWGGAVLTLKLNSQSHEA